MRILFASSILVSMLSVNLQASSELYECTKVFEERKQELILELERIDEQEQALNALKDATEELLKKKEAKADASRADQHDPERHPNFANERARLRAG